MKTIKLAVLAAGLLGSLPVVAETTDDIENTGPQGTGNFVAGQSERYGTPVAGKPEGMGNPIPRRPAHTRDMTEQK